MCKVIRETIVMSEEELKNLPPYVLEDVMQRLRKIEDDLPPRVDRLEYTVESIRKELREMRDEQKEADRRSENSFNDISQKLDKTVGDLTKEITEIGKKIARWSGIVFTISGLLWLFLAYGESLVTIMANIKGMS